MSKIAGELNAEMMNGRETIESLRQQLAEKCAEVERLKANSVKRTHELLDGIIAQAASQLREQQLRAHLEVIAGKRMCVDNCLGNVDIAGLAISIPQDTSALSAMIVKAGEVMRDSCSTECWKRSAESGFHRTPEEISSAIRALPGVTMEDLQK